MIYQDIELNEEPLVSVFVFTYNQSKIVSKTIDSVLDQKLDSHYEIVIVEDCSPDNTFEVCYSYYEKYPQKIRLVKNDKNLGMIRSFYENIYKYARGKFIAEVAGDDWWHDCCKLQKQVDYLESHPGYGLVFSDTLVYSEPEGKLLSYTPTENPCRFEDLIIQNSISALTTCYRRELFVKYVNEVNPIKQNFPGEDYPMWIWMAFNTKIHKIQEPLTTYRLQAETLSHSSSKPKRLQFEVDRLNIKLFFYDHFKLNRPDILHDIYLRFYFLTLNTASEAENVEIEKQRIAFFKENGYYFFMSLGRLNEWFASVPTLSAINRFILKVCAKFRLINRYSRVYNKPVL